MPVDAGGKTMTSPSERFPEIADPALAPFWDGVRAEKIVLQCCAQCGYMRWPPALRCPECLSANTEWKEAVPTGVLVSHATYRRALSADTAGAIPYTVALVRLDDGPQLYGRLQPGDNRAKAGAVVRATFEEIEPGIPFIAWRLDEQAQD
jgi:uncharacterized OB-fold protein